MPRPLLSSNCFGNQLRDLKNILKIVFCSLPGYAGIRCEYEYNECESSPCANGGTCTDRVGEFQCACGRGYTGRTCQLKVSEIIKNILGQRHFKLNKTSGPVCKKQEQSICCVLISTYWDKGRDDLYTSLDQILLFTLYKGECFDVKYLYNSITYFMGRGKV